MYYGWASDFRENSGEGKLARLYLEQFLQASCNSITIISPENNYIFINGSLKKTISKKKVNYNNSFYKYIYPIMGCLFSWYCLISNKKFIFINYLPLWNFLLFIFFAPKTKIGPITGSKITHNNLIRKLIIPIFCKISTLVINLRYSNLYFSTDNLKNYFKKNLRNKKFNFALNYLKKKKYPSIKKKYDIIIYFRKHSNKNINFFSKIAESLVAKNLNVICYGDKLNVKGVKNFGIVDHKYSLKLIMRSKIGINSAENFYTFFMMDCLNSGIHVLCDKKSVTNKILYKKQIILSDYDKFSNTLYKILKYL